MCRFKSNLCCKRFMLYICTMNSKISKDMEVLKSKLNDDSLVHNEA